MYLLNRMHGSIFSEQNDTRLSIGKSKNGIYSVLVGHYQIKVWILDDSDGQIKWMSKQLSVVILIGSGRNVTMCYKVTGLGCYRLPPLAVTPTVSNSNWKKWHRSRSNGTPMMMTFFRIMAIGLAISILYHSWDFIPIRRLSILQGANTIENFSYPIRVRLTPHAEPTGRTMKYQKIAIWGVFVPKS
jgi:hypothetical protein